MSVRIKNLKLKLLITAAYLAFVALMRFLGITCIFKFLFDVSCPGCGITRACLSALRFDFRAAFDYNPMFWAVPVLYLYFLCDGTVFKNKIADTAIISVILAGLAVNWMVRLFFYA